jgi:MoxR-like ATPase
MRRPDAKETGMDGFKGTANYITSKALRDVVNAAIVLKRPLLVKGEPGTGKTRLANAIADDLGMRLIVWNIKSTTKAHDGLYIYDTVQRLHDSRFSDHDVSDIRHYIRPGKLGESFASDEKVVLLIDEIDKADLEFPNDLLNELDEMSFHIHETDEQITAKHRPVVIITSNNEKELPDAFLRRCLFHFIEFPNEEMMEAIVRVHHPDVEKVLIREAMKRFFWIRELDALRKKPSTSELIDWVQALVAGGIDPARLRREIPFLGVLIKKEQDVDVVLAQQLPY